MFDGKQETAGFFFCMEDRALLCRKCDVAIHSANAYVTTHQRFLLTGVRVGLEYRLLRGNLKKLLKRDPILCQEEKHQCRRHWLVHTIKLCLHSLMESKSWGLEIFRFLEVEATNQWHLDDFLGMPDFNQNYGYIDNGSSKVCLLLFVLFTALLA